MIDELECKYLNRMDFPVLGQFGIQVRDRYLSEDIQGVGVTRGYVSYFLLCISCICSFHLFIFLVLLFPVTPFSFGLF